MKRFCFNLCSLFGLFDFLLWYIWFLGFLSLVESEVDIGVWEFDKVEVELKLFVEFLKALVGLLVGIFL